MRCTVETVPYLFSTAVPYDVMIPYAGSTDLQHSILHSTSTRIRAYYTVISVEYESTCKPRRTLVTGIG